MGMVSEWDGIWQNENENNNRLLGFVGMLRIKYIYRRDLLNEKYRKKMRKIKWLKYEMHMTVENLSP